MNLLRPLVAAGALTLTLLGAGQGVSLAADMPKTLPPPAYPSPTLERSPRLFDDSGWYLRGDIGYGWGLIDSAQSAPGFPNPTDSRLGNGLFGGIGGGIKTKWLRTDVVFDYQSALKYQGTIATPGDVTAKMSAWSVLFNGYVDLGTWYRMTPYIGAGAGAAMVHTSDFTSTLAPPFAGGLSSNQWNFAWAGMAGVGYAIGPNLMVDVGYRYINFGDTKSAADSNGYMTFKNLAAHQVRVGLRWSFDDLPPYR